METVYLSLGSNLGDREHYLRQALSLLETPQFRVTRVSPVYETDPVDRLDQPKFLNLVAEGVSRLDAEELLGHAQAVENRLGRRRVEPKGPRTIDIDILFYGGTVVETPRLTIPHPRAHCRRFVLEPLSEIAPDYRHPVTGETVREMLGSTMDQRVSRAT